jgi:hypothetical protein
VCIISEYSKKGRIIEARPWGRQPRLEDHLTPKNVLFVVKTWFILHEICKDCTNNLYLLSGTGFLFIIPASLLSCAFILEIRYSEKVILDSPAVNVLGVRSRKLSNIGQSSDGWPKKNYLLLLRASNSNVELRTLSRWSRVHLHPPTRTGPAWWGMARSP